MNHRIKTAFILMLLAVTASAQQPIVVNLWQGGAPHPSADAADTAKLYVYLPPAKLATGRAVVICPGGGYEWLAIDSEGKDWAPFFNNLGIAAIVLKYRLPHGDYRVPVEDAAKALETARAHSADWHIHVHDVGIMGSSAGGHLASTLATHAAGDAKPNFQMLFYPVISMIPGQGHTHSHNNFFSHGVTIEQEAAFSNDRQVTATTPRAWIGICSDDAIVPVQDGVDYYLSLQKHHVPAALFVYPTGGHGWAVHENFAFHNEMEMELKAWLHTF